MLDRALVARRAGFAEVEKVVGEVRVEIGGRDRGIGFVRGNRGAAGISSISRVGRSVRSVVEIRGRWRI